jgi:hypothetical protein
MSVPARYQAFWVPGLDHDIDRDENLRAGLRWLADVERRHSAPGGDRHVRQVDGPQRPVAG